MTTLKGSTPAEPVDVLFQEIRKRVGVLAESYPDNGDPEVQAHLAAVLESAEQGIRSSTTSAGRSPVAIETTRTLRRAVQELLDGLSDLVAATVGHVSLALEASPQRPINRQVQLQQAREAAELSAEIIRRLSVLV